MHRILGLSTALLALVFGFLIQTATPSRANPDFDLGPPINAHAPDIGTPRDSTGTPRALNSLMGEKGLVLFFFRSADWCPFCQAQMMDLNTGVAGMERRGYRLAGISYDAPEILKTFIERRGLRGPHTGRKGTGGRTKHNTPDRDQRGGSTNARAQTDPAGTHR